MKITKAQFRKLIREAVRLLDERGSPDDEEHWMTGVDNRTRRAPKLPNDPDWRTGYNDGSSDEEPTDEKNEQYMNGYAAGQRGTYR